MLATNQVIAAILKGAHDANRELAAWSPGTDVFDYGIEQHISSSVARSLYNSAMSNHGLGSCHITLETSFGELRANNRVVARGRRPLALGDAGRADIVVWNSDVEPVGAIEVKRRFRYSIMKDDINRLQLLLRKFSGEEGSFQWGALVGMERIREREVKPPDTKLFEFMLKVQSSTGQWTVSGDWDEVRFDEPYELLDQSICTGIRAYAVLMSARPAIAMGDD